MANELPGWQPTKPSLALKLVWRYDLASRVQDLPNSLQ